MSKFLLQSGGGFFTLQGGGGVLELQSTVAGGATGTASLASVTMTAPAVTASAITDGTGTLSAPDITLFAPSTTAASASDGNGSASLAPVTLTAPNATATGTTSATASASIDALSIIAPSATASGTGNATASVALAPITISEVSVNGLVPPAIDVNIYPAFEFNFGNGNADGVVIVGDYIYAICSSIARLFVIDATDKNALSSVTFITLSGFPQYICADASNVYITTGLGSSNLIKVDISTPTAPTVVTSVSIGTGAFAIAENGSYLYLTGSAADTIVTYDKASLTLQSTSACAVNPVHITLNGGYAYVSGGITTSILEIWDIATAPATPALIGSTTFGTIIIGQQIAVSGNYAYSTSGTEDIVVIDVTTKSAPSVVYTNTVTSQTRVGANIGAGDSFFAAIASNGDFYYYDVSAPTSPVFTALTNIGTITTVRNMFKDGNYLYAIGHNASSRYFVTPILFSLAAVSNTAIVESPFIDIAPPSVSVSASSVKVSVSAPDITLKAPTIVIGSADNGIHKTVISQYANSPQILELVQNYADVFNAQRLLVDFVYNIWDVRTANSLGLDIWGRIVGVSRYLTLTNQDYFGFDPDFDPFNESPFFSGTAVTNTYILSDDDFRRVILAKALNNISRTTIPAIDRILNLLYGHRGVTFAQVTGDFELTYVFNFEPTAIDQAIAEAPDLLPKPAGFTIINDFIF